MKAASDFNRALNMRLLGWMGLLALAIGGAETARAQAPWVQSSGLESPAPIRWANHDCLIRSDFARILFAADRTVSRDHVALLSRKLSEYRSIDNSGHSEGSFFGVPFTLRRRCSSQMIGFCQLCCLKPWDYAVRDIHQCILIRDLSEPSDNTCHQMHECFCIRYPFQDVCVCFDRKSDDEKGEYLSQLIRSEQPDDVAKETSAPFLIDSEHLPPHDGEFQKLLTAPREEKTFAESNEQRFLPVPIADLISEDQFSALDFLNYLGFDNNSTSPDDPNAMYIRRRLKFMPVDFLSVRMFFYY